MRVHLGHHFYGAGNLGDDFMLAGFLGAMGTLAPPFEFTACVPFPLEPLRRRFPAVDWQPYDAAVRARAIAACDLWLGLGGSPFQSARSRWFVDHLVGDAEFCRLHGKRMFFLGIGVQTAEELAVPEVQELCAQASGIWTRDAGSAQRIASVAPHVRASAAADLAHLFFSRESVPSPAAGRLTAVLNFDYGSWPGQEAFHRAVGKFRATEHVWLAQETRDLPGSERALHAALSAGRKERWKLALPDIPGRPLGEVMPRWPTGEWLLTARYHAAMAGCWAGSKVVVIRLNEKLRGAAEELGLPSVPVDAGTPEVLAALETAAPCQRPAALAAQAFEACAAFVRAAG